MITSLGSPCGSKRSPKACVEPKKSGPVSSYVFQAEASGGFVAARIVVLCLQAKLSAERMVPTTTATARSWTTVTKDTMAITAASALGIFRTIRSELHEKVDSQTMNMMPTRAAIGTCPSKGAPATIPRPKMTAMAIPESRLVAPDCTLTCVCPIIAHPPMPLDSPLKTLPRPWPMHSLEVSPLVPSSSRPSTSCKVSSDSTSPTDAIVAA
mmetsp:Transcript_4537/g.12473  ORF Transcript_4537/g.12473 Transcript_4537/m.12473 type:complete len:211 (-) Transcript_4537:821-1453(-)